MSARSIQRAEKSPIGWTVFLKPPPEPIAFAIFSTGRFRLKIWLRNRCMPKCRVKTLNGNIRTQFMAAKIAPSGNFQNPLGLVFRMLTSGKRAAYAALIHEALRLVARPIDTLLKGKEAKTIAAAQSNDLPVVLVVGAPRSGTTLVYQTLARYLDVSYVTNMTSMFPNSPVSGSRLFRWIPRRDSADFHNFYGQTAGLHGPNDGFSLWNKWLGDDRYLPRTDLTEAEQQTMHQFFYAWSNAFGKPFLNKNNRNTGCLDLLSRVIPQASFVVVRRNPLLVAQSLIKAREQVQGDKSIGWGLHSHSSDTVTDPLSYVDDVCDQILQIEKQLDDQLQHVPVHRLIEITYEGFCEDPAATLRFIGRKISHVLLKEDLITNELKPFEVSAKITLTDAEQARLMAGLKSRRSGTENSAANRSAAPLPSV